MMRTRRTWISRLRWPVHKRKRIGKTRMHHQLQEKISTRSLRVAVIGLGYVGLPLAITFAEAGFRVTGIDVDEQKIDRGNRGESYIPDISSSTIQALIEAKRLHFTSDYAALDDVDAMSICVPTPLSKT